MGGTVTSGVVRVDDDVVEVVDVDDVVEEEVAVVVWSLVVASVVASVVVVSCWLFVLFVLVWGRVDIYLFAMLCCRLLLLHRRLRRRLPLLGPGLGLLRPEERVQQI